MRFTAPFAALGLLAAVTNPALALEPRPLVQVNEQILSDLHLGAFLDEHATNAADPQEQMAMLNQMINTAMVAQSATAEGLADRPEVAAAIDVARMHVLARAGLEHYLRQHAPDEAAIQQAYAEQVGDTPTTEYRARHILLESRDEAAALIKRLDQGEDFATLAKAHSTGPSGPRGGDLGWFEASQMVAPFAAEVTALAVGSHSTEPVETQFGWHVVAVEDSRTTPVPSLDEVRADLVSELQRAAAADYLAGIRDGAKVEFVGMPAED